MYRSTRPVPTLIATRHRELFHQAMPGLRIADVKWFSFSVYPLSGGFKSWSLVNGTMAKLAP